MKKTLTILSRIASDVHLMFRRPVREQYGALCYRVKKKRGQVEVLLITSRDTGRWIIPKGWPMGGKSAPQAAAREAWEEAGVKGKIEREPFGAYRYMKALQQGLKVDCRVLVFPLDVEDMAKNFPEKNERTSEWVDCTEAASRVQEAGLKALILAFEQRMLGELTPTRPDGATGTA